MKIGINIHPTMSSRRVIRGGSYLNVTRDLRTADRNWCGHENRSRADGFRLVLPSPPPPSPPPSPPRVRMKNHDKQNLIDLLRSEDHFDQAVELCRSLNLSSDTVLGWLGFGLEIVSIPGGTGVVGGEGCRESVEFESFEMAATLTTVAQWAAIMGWLHTGTARRPVSVADRTDRRPVVNVTAYEVDEFCRRLESIYGLDGVAVEVRAPHSAEWEYAAQGGEKFTYAGSDDPDEVAWYAGNSGYKLQPVGQKKPNGYGLYDMSGNAYTWTCTSWAGDDPSGAKAYRTAIAAVQQ